MTDELCLFSAGPVILRAPSSIGVEILSNTSLPCKAEGLPKPKVNWKRADGTPMNFQGRFTVEKDGSLTIHG